MLLQQGDQCSLPWQQHWRMIPDHNWSAPRMSALPHRLQHLLWEDNGWCTWRPWRNSQYRRQDNYKLTFCSEKTQTEVVRARHTIIWTGPNYPTGNSSRRKTIEEAERRNDGKTTSKSGLALNGTSCYGKLRTSRSGGSWLKNLLWCSNGQPDYGIDKIR